LKGKFPTYSFRLITLTPLPQRGSEGIASAQRDIAGADQSHLDFVS
jgi:hypothetical protein